jgi:hypothetical protein
VFIGIRSFVDSFVSSVCEELVSSGHRAPTPPGDRRVGPTADRKGGLAEEPTG